MRRGEGSRVGSRKEDNDKGEWRLGQVKKVEEREKGGGGGGSGRGRGSRRSRNIIKCSVINIAEEKLKKIAWKRKTKEEGACYDAEEEEEKERRKGKRRLITGRGKLRRRYATQGWRRNQKKRRKRIKRRE